MSQSTRAGLALLVCTSLSTTLLSCSKNQKSEEEQKLEQAQAADDSLDFSVGPDTQNVLYTWVDEKGSFHLTEKESEIPKGARKQVRVVVDGHSPGSAAYVYVADLTALDGGNYPVSSMPRSEWEQIGKSGRDKQLAALAPETQEEDAPSPAQLDVDAIIYGADWCKPCHLAENYLKSKGARVIKKDIEEDPSAAKEMGAVLRQAGMTGSSIPVLNVGGTVLRGFSAKAIDAALARAKK